MPVPDDSVNDGAALYRFPGASEKLDDSLAMYCVGLFVTLLFNVTARLVVDAAPVDRKGRHRWPFGQRDRVADTGYSPTAFLTLK